VIGWQAKHFKQQTKDRVTGVRSSCSTTVRMSEGIAFGRDVGSNEDAVDIAAFAVAVIVARRHARMNEQWSIDN
jgi:hypothetical protein